VDFDRQLLENREQFGKDFLQIALLIRRSLIRTVHADAAASLMSASIHRDPDRPDLIAGQWRWIIRPVPFNQPVRDKQCKLALRDNLDDR
jgi:hypothetical protein